jgi:hypothetical protein
MHQGGGGKPALPLTRKWVDDYCRWIREGCPTSEQELAQGAAPAMPKTFAQWLERNPAPDLQALVKRAGGYEHITTDEWAEFDRRRAEWEARRRDYVRRT